MPSAASLPIFRERAFVWALVLSIVLHGALLLTKGFEFDRSPPADSLIIELQQVEEPLPPPPQPEPPPPKPQPPKAPSVKPKPAPAPVPVTESPAPLPPPQAQPDPEPAPQPAPPPEVVSVAPQAEVPPAFTAPPPPEPPRIPSPSQQDIDAARNGYSLLLAREFSKYRQYPRIAQLRGWQGTVRVQLELDSNGNITQSSIKESSGFDVLDRQALDMVKKATPLPLPPEVLRNRAFSILVPVTFKLN